MKDEALKLALRDLENAEIATDSTYESTALIRKALAQPAQEPVQWCSLCGRDIPPQRPWVGLTDEDIALIDWESLITKKDCVRAIQSKLKERNA